MAAKIVIEPDLVETIAADLAWEIHEQIDLDPHFVSREAWQEAFDFIDNEGLNAAIDRLARG